MVGLHTVRQSQVTRLKEKQTVTSEKVGGQQTVTSHKGGPEQNKTMLPI